MRTHSPVKSKKENKVIRNTIIKVLYLQSSVPNGNEFSFPCKYTTLNFRQLHWNLKCNSLEVFKLKKKVVILTKLLNKSEFIDNKIITTDYICNLISNFSMGPSVTVTTRLRPLDSILANTQNVSVPLLFSNLKF